MRGSKEKAKVLGRELRLISSGEERKDEFGRGTGRGRAYGVGLTPRLEEKSSCVPRIVRQLTCPRPQSPAVCWCWLIDRSSLSLFLALFRASAQPLPALRSLHPCAGMGVENFSSAKQWAPFAMAALET